MTKKALQLNLSYVKEGEKWIYLLINQFVLLNLNLQKQNVLLNLDLLIRLTTHEKTVVFINAPFS
jgi:hypothetical protein